jgi:hypothetical protein
MAAKRKATTVTCKVTSREGKRDPHSFTRVLATKTGPGNR